MKRLTAAGLLVAAALLGAPSAAADPEILDPYCNGQEPVFGACKPAPDQTHITDAPGANPGVAVGLDPELVPVI